VVETGAIAIRYPLDSSDSSHPPERQSASHQSASHQSASHQSASPESASPESRSHAPLTRPTGTQRRDDRHCDPDAIVLRWSLQPGDQVVVDQELLVLAVGDEVQSIRSPVAGVLLNHWSEEGDRLGSGETLGWIRPTVGDGSDASKP